MREARRRKCLLLGAYTRHIQRAGGPTLLLLTVTKRSQHGILEGNAVAGPPCQACKLARNRCLIREKSVLETWYALFSATDALSALPISRALTRRSHGRNLDRTTRVGLPAKCSPRRLVSRVRSRAETGRCFPREYAHRGPARTPSGRHRTRNTWGKRLPAW